MPHTKPNRLLFSTLVVAFTLIAAGIGFAIGQLTDTPPLPTPTPTPTPEPKAGISDYASLYAKIDQDAFPPHQYLALLTRLTNCLPDLTGQFKTELSNTTLSEGETAALSHFLTSSTIIVANTSNPFLTQTIHRTLSTIVTNCPQTQTLRHHNTNTITTTPTPTPPCIPHDSGFLCISE